MERALVALGLPPAQRQVPIRLRDGTTVRPDLYWPELGFAVEVDHVTWHGGRSDSQRDKWRDRQLRHAGVDTMRVTDEDVRERFAAAVRDIADEVSTRLKGTTTTDSGAKPRQSARSA